MKRHEKRQAAREARRGVSVSALMAEDGGLPPEARHVFLMEDCVHLTPELQAELAGRGWPADHLRECAERGGHHCRPRESIIFAEPQGLEMMLRGGEVLIHQHELVIGGKPFHFSV